MCKSTKLYLFLDKSSMNNVYSDFKDSSPEAYQISLVDELRNRVGAVTLSFNSTSNLVDVGITYGKSTNTYAIGLDKLETSLKRINFLHHDGVYSILSIEPLSSVKTKTSSSSPVPKSIRVPSSFIRLALTTALNSDSRELNVYKFRQGLVRLERDSESLIYTLVYGGEKANYSYTESIKATSISDELIRNLIFKPIYFTVSAKPLVQEVVSVIERNDFNSL